MTAQCFNLCVPEGDAVLVGVDVGVEDNAPLVAAGDNKNGGSDLEVDDDDVGSNTDNPVPVVGVVGEITKGL